jgi:hypothetical protein
MVFRAVAIDNLTVARCYLRFVSKRIDEGSHKPQGVLVAAYSLLDSGELNQEEWKQLREILNWFNTHLPHPPKSFFAGRAIFWFKPGAKDCISQIWDLVAILREHGHHVEVHRCPRLANVCYRDQFQVAAYPSKEDGRITVR